MTDKHPYVTSPGGLIQVINHLRKSFPTPLTADSIKKLGYAPKNETYIINTLRFLKIIDQDSNKTATAGRVFSTHQDKDFHDNFAKIIKESYKDLFALHGEETWKLDTNTLITFFRQNDQSGAVVGSRQAKTFLTLCGLSGKQQLPGIKGNSKTENSQKSNEQKKTKNINKKINESVPQANNNNDVGLTVRIEINLPADGTQETYDHIFKSIRENLLNS